MKWGGWKELIVFAMRSAVLLVFFSLVVVLNAFRGCASSQSGLIGYFFNCGPFLKVGRYCTERKRVRTLYESFCLQTVFDRNSAVDVGAS